MIRHDDGGDYNHPLALKVPQRFGYDLRAFASAQETCTMSGIEPALDRSRKPLVILAFGLVARPRAVFFPT